MTEHGSIIYLEGVTVDYDGFKALNNLNFIVNHRELRVVIGPNGAGKTTLLDVISGKTKPVAGRVIFGKDTDLIGMREYEITQLGIGRKFQAPSIYGNLTVWENLDLSLSRPSKGVLSTLRGQSTPVERKRIDEALETIGLTEQAALRAGSLSHGQRLGDDLRADEMDMCVDAPGGDDFPLGRQHLGTGADLHTLRHAVHQVGVARLSDADDPAVPDSDVRLHDAPPIDDDRVRHDEIQSAFRSGSRRRLSHAVSDHLAAAELGLFARNRKVAGDLDDQVRIGQPDAVSCGRTVQIGVLTAWNLHVCRLLKPLHDGLSTRSPFA